MGRRRALTSLLAACAFVFVATPVFATPGAGPARVNTVLSSGEVRGIVTGADDGIGLKRVRVVLRSDETREVVKSMRTRRDGEFDFDGVPSGIYSLEAAAPGYLPTIVAPVVIRVGQARVEHITLTPLTDRRPAS